LKIEVWVAKKGIPALERYPAEVAFLAPNTELIRVRALARKDQRIQAIRFEKCLIPSWPMNLDSKQTNCHVVFLPMMLTQNDK
jgi:hypothetical protein